MSMFYPDFSTTRHVQQRMEYTHPTIVRKVRLGETSANVKFSVSVHSGRDHDVQSFASCDASVASELARKAAAAFKRSWLRRRPDFCLVEARGYKGLVQLTGSAYNTSRFDGGHTITIEVDIINGPPIKREPVPLVPLAKVVAPIRARTKPVKVDPKKPWLFAYDQHHTQYVQPHASRKAALTAARNMGDNGWPVAIVKDGVMYPFHTPVLDDPPAERRIRSARVSCEERGLRIKSVGKELSLV